MNLKDIESLKYYLLFVLIALSTYVYSGVVGWKWLGATPTDKSKLEHKPGYHHPYLHK